MYVISQAGNIYNDKLKQHLDKFGCEPEPITPGLCLLQYSLVVDDFGVQYKIQADITHLRDALKTIYKISDE